MSKPLKLTIYPHSPKHFNSNWLTFYVTPEGLMAAGQGGVIPASKRLSEAELAAEWHRHTHTFDMLAEGYRVESFGTDYIQGGHHEARVLQQQETLHRFATHPHYFEATEPESDTE